MRKHRTDTAKSAADMFDVAQQPPLMPPAHCNVPDEVLPFWHTIISRRPRETWNDYDQEIASELAKDQFMAQRLRREVEENGATSNGKPTAEAKVLDTTVKRIALLTRLLLLNTTAQEGKQEDMQKRHAAEKAAAKQVEEVKKYNGLIATRH